MCAIQPIWRLKDSISDDYSFNWLSKNTHPRAIEILRDGKDDKRINWYNISVNSSAFEFQMENFDKINWNGISDNHNPRAYELLMKNQDKIYWPYLSANPNAVELLEKNMDKINIYELYRNPKAVPLIKKLSKKMKRQFGKYIGSNHSEEAIPLIMSNIHIYRRDKMLHITPNPFAIDIIKDNLDYMTDIDWQALASNEHPEAIELLRYHCPVKPPFYYLVTNKNPDAFKLLMDVYKDELKKDDFMRKHLYENPNIFELDYGAMKQKNQWLEQELLAKVMEPSRVFKYGGLSYLNELFSY